MDREKQIEEMARIICCTSHIPETTCKTCCSIVFGRIPEKCEYRDFVTQFIDVGYGNVRQAVKEFAEKLKADLNNAYVNATTPFQAGKNAGLDNALILIDERIEKSCGKGET